MRPLVDLNRKVVLTGSVVSSYPNLILDLIGIDYYFDISPPIISSADVQLGGGYQYEFQLNNKGLKNDTFGFILSDASLAYSIFDKDGIASNSISYDGINNLVIAIDENSSSKQSGQCSFDVTHISDNRTLSIDGSTNPDPSSPPDGILQTLQPNVKLRFKEPYDFVVTASTTETVVNCGKSYTFTAQVENIGRLDDTYHLDVHNGTQFNYTLRDLANLQDITQVSASSDSTVRFLVKVEIPIVGVKDGDIEDIWLKSMSAVKPQYSEGIGLTTTARVIPLKVAMPVYDWTSQDIQTTGRFMNSIWGRSGSDLAAVGSDGKIMHYDGTSWTEKPSHTTNPLHSIWGLSANEMYAVGERGTILQYNGTSWSKMPLTQPNTLYHIWGDATDNMYAVGESGLILNYDGNSWTEMRSPTFNDLFWIWGDNQNNMFIVGAAGTILSYIDNKWISMTSPVANDLVTIWGISASSLYAAGSGGTIIHYDGNQWSDFMSPIREDIFGIWGSQDNDMYASTIFGQVYHYDGSTWTKVFQDSDLSFQGAFFLL